MSGVVVRKATFVDAEYIALLARFTFTETFGSLFRDPQDLLAYYDKTFSVSKLRESISKENNVFWIAIFDELPVGTIGSERVWLSVLVSNQRAIGFYNKHGFVAFGDQTFSIGKETFEFITMSKDLTV
eukprot:gene18187-20711_t